MRVHTLRDDGQQAAMCPAEMQNAVAQKDEKNWRWKTVWKSAHDYHKNMLEMQDTHKDGRIHDKTKKIRLKSNGGQSNS